MPPLPAPLAQLVKVAGSRWRIEDGFAGGKELAALDEHQVRSWTSWHRWTILALLAYAFLSVLAATQPGGSRPHDGQLIPLTLNEIRQAVHRATPAAARTPARSCTGHDGDDDTKPPPEPATTGNDPSHPHDYEVSLDTKR